MTVPFLGDAELTAEVAVRALAVAAFIGLSLAGALRDAASFTIPDWVSIGIVAAFGVAVLTGHPPPSRLAGHVGAALVVFAIGWALFHVRVFGGGDVKMMSAVALWAGFGQLAGLVFLIALFGGLLTVALLAARVTVPAAVLATRPTLHRLIDGRHGVPYGIAIAAGVLTNFVLLPLLLQPAG